MIISNLSPSTYTQITTIEVAVQDAYEQANKLKATNYEQAQKGLSTFKDLLNENSAVARELNKALPKKLIHRWGRTINQGHCRSVG